VEQDTPHSICSSIASGVASILNSPGAPAVVKTNVTAPTPLPATIGLESDIPDPDIPSNNTERPKPSNKPNRPSVKRKPTNGKGNKVSPANGIKHKGQNNGDVIKRQNSVRSQVNYSPGSKNKISPVNVPTENTVTCSVEVHREKTPSEMSTKENKDGVDNLAYESSEGGVHVLDIKTDSNTTSV